jgi:putative phosphoesterase
MSSVRLGIVSDTHGMVRPELVKALKGVDHILHLGDVGSSDVLKALEAIAPLHAVRGNVDIYGPESKLPATEVLIFAGHYLYLLHDLKQLSLNPEAAKFSVVLHGHTHRPSIEKRRGVLYFNPGSAGARRFLLPVSCGFLTLDEGKEPVAEVITLLAGE